MARGAFDAQLVTPRGDTRPEMIWMDTMPYM